MKTDVGVIERVIDIAASPETVYRLLTDPVEYIRWKGRAAELDPRVGGVFRVAFKESAVSGRYVEVIPNRRVVFTWGWEAPDALVRPGGSTVEIDLERQGSGTRLRLVHRGLAASELASHTEGWDYFLPRLIAVAEGREAAA
ncbi:MAG: SRPBCC domain-containing protein [Candidatus Limnocylindria bacterium]